MATRVDLGQISVTLINCATLNTPVSCKNFGDISYVSRDIANFVVKLANLRYYGNKGRTRVNFHDTVKLRDLGNPLRGARISEISRT